MGAINYRQINAKLVYAIEGEEFDSDNTELYYATESFPFTNEWSEGTGPWTPDIWQNRNFPSFGIASKSIYIDELDLFVEVNIFAVSGYYCGITLDYDIICDAFIARALSEYDRNTAKDDLTADILEDNDLEASKAPLIRNAIDRLEDEAEKICRELSTAIYSYPGWVMNKIA